MQPAYSHSDFKMRARAENIRLYRRITGMKSVPRDRQYWTLCNRQTLDRGSEIVQMMRSGLITERQFVGVDWDGAIIEMNRVDHPKATWIAGEWSDVIGKYPEFKPGLIYLDTTSFAEGDGAVRLTVGTMLRCPPGTMVLTNLMLNDPRSRKKFTADHLMEMISKNISGIELEKWDHEVVNFEYSMTGYTRMGTFVLNKRA